MKAIFQQTKNPLGINGVPIEVKQIIDGQAVVILPSGKKTFLEVVHLKSFCGEINFVEDQILPDAETVAPVTPTPAPLFEPAVEDLGFGKEATTEVTEAPKAGKNK